MRKATSIHTTDTNRHYTRVTNAARALGVHVDYIRSRLGTGSGIRTLGRKDGILVCIEDLRSHPDFIARLDAEVKVDAKGFFNDANGCWCTVDAFWENLDETMKSQTTKQAVLLQAQMYCHGKDAVNRWGQPCAKVYLFNDLLATGLRLLSIGRIINPYTRFCTDEDGVKWSSKRFWMEELRVTDRALDNGVKKLYGSWEKVPQELGRNAVIRNGKVVLQKTIPLFSEGTIREILAYILEAPIQVVGGVYEIIDKINDEVKAVYESASKLSEEIPVHVDYINRKLKSYSCPRLEGIDRRCGTKVSVYELQIAREIFRDQIKIVVNTDENGEFVDSIYGKCVTIERFCQNHPEVDRKDLVILLEELQHRKIVRRDIRTNLIVTLYPKIELAKLSQNLVQ